MYNLGIEIDELIDLLSTGHEAVFILDGKEYIIQPECTDSSDDLVLYQSAPEVLYLCRIAIPSKNVKETSDGIRYGVGKEPVKKILSPKCIEGKSFMDLINQIHPEESHSSAAYIKLHPNGTVKQIRIYNKAHTAQTDIDFSAHRGTVSLHAHDYINGVRQEQRSLNKEEYAKYRNFWRHNDDTK